MQTVKGREIAVMGIEGKTDRSSAFPWSSAVEHLKNNLNKKLKGWVLNLTNFVTLKNLTFPNLTCQV